ncbi:PDR/VanB family oxidoreductase [Neisseriaceae bacterium TC5R-5]|nr:PDR/VanB family oxidoreductase [Neisseriaceae bacterium TC5R-5]
MSDLLELKLINRQELTSEITEFTFSSAQGKRLPTFKAGANLLLLTPSGKWRNYSLVNDDVEHYIIAVKREDAGRGGSFSMHTQLHIGMTIAARAPQNTFALVPAPHYVLIAGGVGITPILSMLRRLIRQNAKVEMIYLTRSREQTAYLDLLSSEPFVQHVKIHHSSGSSDDRYDFWPVFRTPDLRHIYFCAPSAMNDAIYLQTIHWPRSQIHYETFTGVETTGEQSKPFRLRRALTDEVWDVPADKSILDVLREHNISFLSSCESGCCGTCRMQVISGEVLHKDVCLSKTEQTQMMTPCVSRALGEEITLKF